MKIILNLLFIILVIIIGLDVFEFTYITPFQYIQITLLLMLIAYILWKEDL